MKRILVSDKVRLPFEGWDEYYRRTTPEILRTDATGDGPLIRRDAEQARDEKGQFAAGAASGAARAATVHATSTGTREAHVAAAAAHRVAMTAHASLGVKANDRVHRQHMEVAGSHDVAAAYLASGRPSVADAHARQASGDSERIEAGRSEQDLKAAGQRLRAEMNLERTKAFTGNGNDRVNAATGGMADRASSAARSASRAANSIGATRDGQVSAQAAHVAAAAAHRVAAQTRDHDSAKHEATAKAHDAKAATHGASSGAKTEATTRPEILSQQAKEASKAAKDHASAELHQVAAQAHSIAGDAHEEVGNKKEASIERRKAETHTVEAGRLSGDKGAAATAASRQARLSSKTAEKQEVQHPTYPQLAASMHNYAREYHEKAADAHDATRAPGDLARSVESKAHREKAAYHAAAIKRLGGLRKDPMGPL